MRAQEPALAFDVSPSRWRRGALWGLALLVLLAAPVRARGLEVPWPLLAVLALPLLPRLLPELEARRIELEGMTLRVETSIGERRGRVLGDAAITPFAVEIPVAWADAGHERLVVWRDAVDDASYRRLARALRRTRTESR